MMHRLFLFRAYGDAAIALHFLVNSPNKVNYTVIASNHLKPLLIELSKYINIASIDIVYIDIGITKSQLNLFTNRHIFSRSTISQISKLKGFLKSNPNKIGIDYIEQDKKSALLNFFTGHIFTPIIKQQVYKEMSDFFSVHMFGFKKADCIKNILVLPDARIQARKIPDTVVENIKLNIIEPQQNLKLAYFSSQKIPTVGGIDKVIYDNFEQLLSLINNADFIFGADSLAIHLCNILQKPHFILYPKNGSTHFFTPYSLENNYYTYFQKFSSLQFKI